MLSYLRKPTPETLALRELEEAKRQLLVAQSGKEYADSMVKYHEARIKRLTKIIAESMNDTSANPNTAITLDSQMPEMRDQ